MSLTCSFFVALYTIIIQRTVSKYRIFNTALYFVTFSTLIMIILMLPRYKTLLLTNSKIWLIGILMAFFTILLTRLFLFHGIKRIGASRMSIIASSELIFASLFAFLFLGEGFDLIQGLGALLIFNGSVFVNFDKTETLWAGFIYQYNNLTIYHSPITPHYPLNIAGLCLSQIY